MFYQNKLSKQHNSGSAIIVTMLFGTVAVSLTLLLAVFAVNDYTQVSMFDEANTATYANEAATEFILQSYRYDRGVSILCNNDNTPIKNANIYLSGDTLKAKDKNGIEISVAKECESKTNKDLSTSGNNLKTDAEITTKLRTYYFKETTPLDDPDALTIELTRNQGKEFAIPKRGSGQIVEFQTKDINPVAERDKRVDLECTQINENGIEIKKEILSYFKQNDRVTKQITLQSSATILRLRAYFHEPGINEAILIDPNATVTFKVYNDFGIFDSGVTTIEAVTEYGNTAMKKITQLDRQSGTVINQGDFVLFSGGGGITQESQ